MDGLFPRSPTPRETSWSHSSCGHSKHRTQSIAEGLRLEYPVPSAGSPELLSPSWNPGVVAEVPKLIQGGSLASHFNQTVPHPLMSRPTDHNGVFKLPDGLDEWAATSPHTTFYLFQPVAPQGLTSILVAPIRFRVSRSDVRAASLTGVKSHLTAVGLILGESKCLSIDPLH